VGDLLGYSILVFARQPRPTQSDHPSLGRWNEFCMREDTVIRTAGQRTYFVNGMAVNGAGDMARKRTKSPQTEYLSLTPPLGQTPPLQKSIIVDYNWWHPNWFAQNCAFLIYCIEKKHYTVWHEDREQNHCSVISVPLIHPNYMALYKFCIIITIIIIVIIQYITSVHKS